MILISRAEKLPDSVYYGSGSADANLPRYFKLRPNVLQKGWSDSLEIVENQVGVQRTFHKGFKPVVNKITMTLNGHDIQAKGWKLGGAVLTRLKVELDSHFENNDTYRFLLFSMDQEAGYDPNNKGTDTTRKWYMCQLKMQPPNYDLHHVGQNPEFQYVFHVEKEGTFPHYWGKATSSAGVIDYIADTSLPALTSAANCPFFLWSNGINEHVMKLMQILTYTASTNLTIVNGFYPNYVLKDSVFQIFNILDPTEVSRL